MGLCERLSDSKWYGFVTESRYDGFTQPSQLKMLSHLARLHIHGFIFDMSSELGHLVDMPVCNKDVIVSFVFILFYS